jgi:DNA repair exonuclease SbcCD ATPase subunit
MSHKIIKLTAENIKKLRAVEITPDGDVVKISGANSAGKTSVLDSILFALAGKNAIPDKPIREGEDSAFVELNLGDLIVKRRFTPGGSTLSVENAEGAVFKSPQSMLDDMMGKLSFDPMKFLQLSRKEQFDELLTLVDVKIDLSELDEKRQSLYEERTIVNREGKAVKTRLEAIPKIENAPDADIDIVVLAEEISQAEAGNRELDNVLVKIGGDKVSKQRFSGELDVFRRGIDSLEEETKDKEKIDIEKMRTELNETVAKLTQQISEAENSNNELQTNLSSLDSRKAAALDLEVRINALDQRINQFEKETGSKEKVDTTELVIKLNNANKINNDYRASQERIAIVDAVKVKIVESNNLTSEIEKIDEKKSEALSVVKFPVDGLSLGDGEITYNDIPLDQASMSEQMRVSIGIAMAANPDIRVIRITDASLFDSSTMKMVEEMAKTDDYQIWMEIVDESGKVGIYIEDGSVSKVN